MPSSDYGSEATRFHKFSRRSPQAKLSSSSSLRRLWSIDVKSRDYIAPKHTRNRQAPAAREPERWNDIESEAHLIDQLLRLMKYFSNICMCRTRVVIARNRCVCASPFASKLSFVKKTDYFYDGFDLKLLMQWLIDVISLKTRKRSASSGLILLFSDFPWTFQFGFWPWISYESVTLLLNF